MSIQHVGSHPQVRRAVAEKESGMAQSENLFAYRKVNPDVCLGRSGPNLEPGTACVRNQRN